MTNFEKIKQMSVEEMAKRLSVITRQMCNYIDDCRDCPVDLIVCGSTNRIKQWLKSEVETE